MAPPRPAGYSGTPLPKKLGISTGSVVALMAAPSDFETTLGPLPPEATLRRDTRGRRDLTIWFVRSRRQLDSSIGAMARAAEQGGVWIAWPKKASGVVTDVGETQIRAQALAHGLVDHKVCAIDATWSGLRFARRR